MRRKANKNRSGQKDSRPKSKNLRPPTSADEKPKLWLLTGIPFQEFCRDILAEQAFVDSCDQHGINGQEDFGVDLIGALSKKTGLMVAQCKAREALTVPILSKTFQDFLEHWDNYWHDKEVKQFFLIAACEIRDPRLLSELKTQKDKFKKLGIDLKWWSNSTLVSKLKNLPEIVNRYIPNWLTLICGSNFQIPLLKDSTPSLNLSTQILEKSTIINGLIGTQITSITEFIKAGNVAQAHTSISEIYKKPELWPSLPNDQKATVITLIGRISIARQDLNSAEKYAIEASELGSYVSTAIYKSFLEQKKGNYDKALSVLEPFFDEQIEKQKLAIYLDMGELQLSRQILDRMQLNSSQDVEVLQLAAYYSLLNREISQALAYIDHALDLEANWRSLKFLSAIIRFYATLAQSVKPINIEQCPPPVDWFYVKSDAIASKRLKESINLFEYLYTSSNNAVEKKQIAGWLLSALCCDRAGEEKARQFCINALEEDLLSWLSISSWAFSRQYDDIIEMSKNKLSSSDISEVNKVVNKLMETLNKNEFAQADLLLETAEQTFEIAGKRQLWIFLKTQTLLLLDEIDKASELVGSRANISLQFLPLINNHEEIKRLLEAHDLDSIEDQDVFEVCLASLRIKNYSFIIENTDRLINSVPTEQALRICAQALYYSEDFEGCRKLLTKHLPEICGNGTPYDLRNLQVQSLQKLGLINQALEYAERETMVNRNVQTILAYLTLLTQAGDIAQVIHWTQILSRDPSLSSFQAYRLAYAIAKDDFNTALKLFQKINVAEIPMNHLVYLRDLSHQLGQERSIKHQEIESALLDAFNDGKFYKNWASEKFQEIINSHTAYVNC